jgi:hypothetical protein
MTRFLFFAVGACLVLQAQEKKPALWSVKDVTAGTLTEIDTGMRALKPDPGSKLLEVRALVQSANADQLQLETRAIFVTTSARAAKSEVVGVGISGKTGACSYELTNGMVSGFVAITSEDGNGFRLGRKTAAEPLGIALTRNPDRLCFGFIVPANANAGMTLHIGNATAPLRLP